MIHDSPAHSSASCTDAPATFPIDLTNVSTGLPDGIYYAGKQLAPWLTFKERLELSELESFWRRQQRPDLVPRYRLLRKRSAEESVVVRWEVDGGRPSTPVVLLDRYTANDAPEMFRDAPRAFIWGDTVEHVDVYRIGHKLLGDVLDANRAHGYNRSSNTYIDEVMAELKVPGPTGTDWMFSVSRVWYLVLEKDLRRGRAAVDGLLLEAHALGVDLGAGEAEATEKARERAEAK